MSDKKITTTGCTREEVDRMIEIAGGVFTREEYPFGKAPTYRVGEDQVIVVYGGFMYISPRGQFHPDMVADLRENWCPVSLADQAWKRNNI